jgi:hypothetical protein
MRVHRHCFQSVLCVPTYSALADSCVHALLLWAALQSGRVSATPRQLEAMIRMSEALARMHLRNEVRRQSCEIACRQQRQL